jgi:hypothetical protein
LCASGAFRLPKRARIIWGCGVPVDSTESPLDSSRNHQRGHPLCRLRLRRNDARRRMAAWLDIPKNVPQPHSNWTTTTSTILNCSDAAGPRAIRSAQVRAWQAPSRGWPMQDRPAASPRRRTKTRGRQCRTIAHPTPRSHSKIRDLAVSISATCPRLSPRREIVATNFFEWRRSP